MSGAYAAGTVDASSVTGAGRALPAESTAVVGPVTSVTDWLPVPG